MSTLRERLRYIRTSKDMTLEAFGASLGVTYNVIANYELGRTNPPEQFLRLLCYTYDVSYYWLDTGNGKPFEYETLDEIEDQLRVVLSCMNEFKVDAIVRLARMPDSWWQDLKNQRGG